MRVLRIPAVVLAIALAGCTTVFVDQPMGTRADPLDAEAWEGYWANAAGNVLYVRLRPEPGTAWVSTIENSDGGEPELVTGIAYLRPAGDGEQLWISFELDGLAGYLWALARREGDEIVLSIPDPEAFRPLVERGELPGRLRSPNGDVLLEALEPSHLQRILADEARDLFTPNVPATLRRITPQQRSTRLPDDR